jgi:DNA-binding CsgD family transcriptional regulator
MSKDAGLSLQERRVVTLRLLGHAYKEIADKLNISEDAIKKHLGSVHRKTGTRSYTELFAKYFTPRLNLNNV